jgi:hypothetical protein
VARYGTTYTYNKGAAIMNTSDIEKLKAEIMQDYNARIEKLKQDMETELSLLPRVIARVEKASPIPKQVAAPILIRRRKAPSAKDRIRAAKAMITGEFERKKLKDIVDNDGYGVMKDGTFSPYVTEMIKKDKEIIEIQQAAGNKPAILRWADE